jgi:hypothetical protein
VSLLHLVKDLHQKTDRNIPTQTSSLCTTGIITITPPSSTHTFQWVNFQALHKTNRNHNEWCSRNKYTMK